MAVSAQSGVFGFGPQAAKGSAPDKIYRHRATMVDLAIQDEVREGDPEVGGIAVPTFPYKVGPLVGGGFTLQPRLEDTLGWLLLGTTGYVTSAATVGVAGAYDHTFKLHPDDSTYVPWMQFRKHIPRKDNNPSTDLGEIHQDGKILGFSMAITNDSPLTTRLDALACRFELDDAPNDWVWDNEFEHWESIPVACQTDGFLRYDGGELPVVAAQVAWQNVPMDIRQERVFGTPFLEDITILQRRLVYQLTVQWRDPALYRKIVTGSPTGLEWASQPFTGAFEVNCASGLNMPGTSTPYSLYVNAEEAMLNQVGGVVLAGNQAIMMRFQGVALESSNQYATIRLRNKKTGYSWPVVGS